MEHSGSSRPDASPDNTPPGGLPSQSAPPRRWLRKLVRPAVMLLVGYLLLVGVMVVLENSLIFFPSVYPEGFWQPQDLAFEDAWFEAPDGTQLHGWYVPHENPRAVILFAHGNGGNLSHRAEIVGQMVRRLGVSMLVFDYRGYGRSAGSPHEAGVLADARAARRWLAQRAGIAESDVVLFGDSLGGGVMVDLAAKDGARGLILLNTFSSLPDVAAFHYRWLPVKMLMRSRLDSRSKIGDYHGPLIQFHGDRDSIVPLSLAERLFDAAHEPKRFVTVPNGDHNDPPTALFFQGLDEFLNTLPPAQERP
jgi:hypothetical protein